MRRSLTLLFLTFLLACHGGPPAPAGPAPRRADEWDALLRRTELHDSTLDFRAFRETYAATPLYAPYGDRDRRARTEIDSLLGRGLNAEGLDRARRALRANPTDATIHLMARYAAEQLADSTSERHHVWMLRGLFESILRTGSGTAAAPYVVISVDEEYDLARYLGFRRQGTQVLSECSGRPCDLVTFTTRAGTDTTLAFDITLPYHALERTFRR